MSDPWDLADLVGEPDQRYVSPVLAHSSQGRQRAWLICVLVLALGLPALVVTLGYNRDVQPAEAAAAPVPTTAAPTTKLDTTSESLVTTASSEETTTTVEETTTSTTAAPTTTSTTYATTSTTAYATTTSTTAVAYQAVQVQAAPPTTAAPITTTTAAPYVAPPPPAPAQGEAAFLACVRQRESGGNYGAVSADGLYRGAYQFHQATWDSVARMAGRGDLVGVPANLAGPADQDLLAVTLYRSSGAAPWGGYCA